MASEAPFSRLAMGAAEVTRIDFGAQSIMGVPRNEVDLRDMGYYYSEVFAVRPTQLLWPPPAMHDLPLFLPPFPSLSSLPSAPGQIRITLQTGNGPPTSQPEGDISEAGLGARRTSGAGDFFSLSVSFLTGI